MPAEIYDEKAAALRASEPELSLSEQIDVLNAERKALEIERAEIDTHNPFSEFDEAVSLRKSYAAIGKQNLSKADKADLLAQQNRIKSIVPRAQAYVAKLKEWSTRVEAHNKRHHRLATLVRKREEFVNAQLWAKRDKAIQDFSGLLAYGMATKQLGDDWQFIAKLCSDYRNEKSPDAKAEVFEIFNGAMNGIKFPGQH